MPAALTLEGRRFGKLSVIAREGSLHGRSAWRCRCDCGNEHLVPASSLVNQLTTSCGCWRREQSSRSPEPKATVKYRMAHQRVTNRRGAATQHDCVDCDRKAAEWSYDHDDPNELTEIAANGQVFAFSQNPDHYKPRCRPCHRKFDHQLAQTA